MVNLLGVPKNLRNEAAHLQDERFFDPFGVDQSLGGVSGGGAALCRRLLNFTPSAWNAGDQIA